MRLTTTMKGEHHITIPNKPLKVGILNAILKDVANHLGKSKKEVIEELFK